MKRIFTGLLTLCILAALTGCDNLGMPVLPTEEPPELQPATSGPAATETQPTTAATEQTTQTEPTETTVATTAPAEEKVPYLQRIDRDDFPIREGPGYDWSWVGTVKEQGTYTIVAEETDDEGNLWGKLKSGAGWVDLTLLAAEKEKPPLVTVSYPDRELPNDGSYHHYSVDSEEYSVTAVFRTYQVLRSVSLFILDAGDNYKEGPQLFTIEQWEPGKPFVAELLFPGSMTMYGLRFTDSAGTVHTWTVTQSGRNGDIVLSQNP